MLGLLLTALAAWHTNQPPNDGMPVLHALERYAYDLRLKASVLDEVDPRIIIIDIDEQSLQRYGQWPWPRAVIAQLVDNLLNDYEVDTLGFDMFFAEPETRLPMESVLKLLEQASTDASDEEVQNLFNQLQGDQILAQSLTNKSVILGYSFEIDDSVKSVGRLSKSLFNDGELTEQTNAPKVTRYSGNIKVLNDAAAQAGFITLSSVTDTDGIVRRVALLNKFEGKLYGALPLMMVRHFLGVEIKPLLAPVSNESEYLALEGLQLAFGDIPLDDQAAVYVPYRKPGAYTYVPAWQILDRAIEKPEQLSGTLALLGTSAAGLLDLRNTPLINSFPGVEVHANLLSGMLDGKFLSQPYWTQGLNFALIVLLGIILSLSLPFLTIARSSLLASGLFVSVLVANALFWMQYAWVVPIATISVLIWLLYSLNTLVGFFAESRSRQIMRSMFGLYIPTEIVDEMSATSDVYSLKSERRDMTVFFSDVRGFTTISEALTPEELSELLNVLLTPITRIIHHNKGAIDKYMGDAVMAFWGAPLKIENHASLAIDTALKIVVELEKLNQEFVEKQWPEMKMGIGLSTGPMNVGNMGSEFRMAYTVLGDSVNLGSRLEGLTKMYGVDIIVSDATQMAAPEYSYQELDLVRVKGKNRPEKIYCPITLRQTIKPQKSAELTKYKQALLSYRAQHWDEAKAQFEQLQANTSAVLYALYLERIEKLRHESLGSDWDGVTIMTTK